MPRGAVSIPGVGAIAPRAVGSGAVVNGSNSAVGIGAVAFAP